MSAHIGKVAGIELTEYAGGKDRGLCVQLTLLTFPGGQAEHGGAVAWSQLTMYEACELAGMLSRWVLEHGGPHA